MKIGTTIDVTGPLFEKDPGATIDQNIARMMEGFAEQGQAAVRGHFPMGSGRDPHPGYGRSGVVGRTMSLTGKQWTHAAVISETNVYPWGGHAAIFNANGSIAFLWRGRNRGGLIRSHRKMAANRTQAQYRGGKIEARHHMFASAARAIRVAGVDLAKGLE